MYLNYCFEVNSPLNIHSSLKHHRNVFISVLMLQSQGTSVNSKKTQLYSCYANFLRLVNIIWHKAYICNLLRYPTRNKAVTSLRKVAKWTPELLRKICAPVSNSYNICLPANNQDLEILPVIKNGVGNNEESEISFTDIYFNCLVGSVSEPSLYFYPWLLDIRSWKI